MTLLETERLVRKIAELLQPGGNAELAPKLAGDFAVACHAANLRLQQCEAMIRAGDRPQAIQLAETAPHLPGLAAALEFPGAEDWRGFCRQNSLPVADKIDAHAAAALRECYARGITTDHPLYTVYRRCMMNRNEEEALQTLHSITRLNPADANAAAELARLDTKVLAARLQHLAASLDTAEPAVLAAEVEAIEAFGFKTKPDGDNWRRAQAVRCEYLLTETAGWKSAARWLDALARLEFIQSLQNEFKVTLPPAVRQQMDALETWAKAEEEKDKRERQFKSLLGDLSQRIQQSEEKDTSARYVKLPELRDDYEALHKIWRSLTDFTRPIPAASTAGFQKRAALLEAEIARRTAIKRRMILSISALVLLAGGVLTWLVLGHLKTRDFARQMEAAITRRQVHLADQLLEQARAKKTGSPGAMADGETFSAREHALLANFEAAFKRLPPTLAGEPEAARLADLTSQLALTHAALDALAPDLKTENEPRLQAFENQWQEYLAECGAAVDGRLDQWLATAEKQGAELDYRAPVEVTTRQLAALSEAVGKITDTESAFGKSLPLRSDLPDRTEAVRGKLAAYEGEIKKLEDGLAALQKARSFGDYSGAIKLITTSEFTTAPAARAAGAMAAMDVSGVTMLRLLLGATNGGTWACLQKPPPLDFIPELVMPAERQRLQQLVKDPLVNGNHQHYRLWLEREGGQPEDWITDDILDESTGWKQVRAWTSAPSATSANFELRDYGYFDGQFKLSPTRPIYRLEHVAALKETAAFHSVGLEQVLAGDAYAKPLLEVLDAVKDSPEGSPLFRAWLFLRLMDVMNLQPDAWGLTFCPAARLHEVQIKSLVGGHLNSGDWFVPAKVSAGSEKLNQFFSSVKLISYIKQAGGLLTAARLAAKDGLTYAGYAGLDGQPNYLDPPVAGEVWGYAANQSSPVLLAEIMAAGRLFKTPALPLSPLYATARPGAEYLVKAGVNPDDAAFRNALPPLFGQPAQP